MALLAGGQVRCGPAAHAPSEQDHVAFLDADDLCQIVIHGVCVLLHFLLVRSARLVEAVPRVLHRQYMHLHLGPEHVQQVEGQADILGVAVEVDDDLISAILAGQVKARDVFCLRKIYLLGLLFFDGIASRLGAPVQLRLFPTRAAVFGLGIFAFLRLGLLLLLGLLRTGGTRVALRPEALLGYHLLHLELVG